MNTDQLLNAFIAAGLDTPEKVVEALSDLTKNLALKQIDIELDSLTAESQKALKPINDKRIDLVNQRAEIIATLSSS